MFTLHAEPHLSCSRERGLVFAACLAQAEDAGDLQRVKIRNSVMWIAATLSAFGGNLGADNYAD